MEMQVSDDYLEIKKKKQQTNTSPPYSPQTTCILNGAMDFHCIVLPPYS